MKTEKVIIDGIEKEIVVELDDDYKNDTININLEDTIEVPVKDIEENLENTKVITIKESGKDHE